MLQIILFHNSCGHEDMLDRCNKLSDDRNVESPGKGYLYESEIPALSYQYSYVL